MNGVGAERYRPSSFSVLSCPWAFWCKGTDDRHQEMIFGRGGFGACPPDLGGLEAIRSDSRSALGPNQP